MKNSIRIYEINSEYIKYLSNYQKHIFEQTDGKGNRKYIGIVLEVKGVKYEHLFKSEKPNPDDEEY